jgi:4-hydroxy-tetrahydrodipicolinate synthase
MQIAGVFCAAATPIREDGSPDLGRLAKHAAQLIADGCQGVALLGTTGEANSFSVAERQQIVEAALDAGIAPDRLMPGTGTCAITDTVALTKHALSLGVTKFVMLPPFYYKLPSDDGLFAAYSAVIEKVADPRLRVVLYHIPQMSAVPLGLPLIERLVSRYPETIVGIKDSSGDFANMEQIVRALPGFRVLAGADPLMRPLLEIGGAGCITAASNLIAAELAIVFRYYAEPLRRTEVEAAQEQIVRMRAIFTRYAPIPAIKAALARRYRDPAWARVRAPLMPLDSAQLAELEHLMGASAEGKHQSMRMAATG